MDAFWLCQPDLSMVIMELLIGQVVSFQGSGDSACG